MLVAWLGAALHQLDVPDETIQTLTRRLHAEFPVDERAGEAAFIKPLLKAVVHRSALTSAAFNGSRATSWVGGRYVTDRGCKRGLLRPSHVKRCLHMHPVLPVHVLTC